MKALISPQENNRICEVSAQPFEVAEPMRWVDCGADVTPQTHSFNGTQFVAAVVPQEAIIAAFTTAIQRRLDDFALTRIYDNVGSLSKYSSFTDAEITSLPVEDRAAVIRYRSECRYLLLKTAQTWAVGERILAQVKAGTRPMPTGISDIEADLPALVWPA